MTESTNHQAAALEQLSKVTNLDYPNPHVTALTAQTHALLEVAEQLRISNLLTALALPQVTLDEKDATASTNAMTRARVARRNTIAATVREGLGL